uniref:Uncharacterized protein n=1 Tax=Eufriesea mexicana TaxID=516756 RepID=A0A310SEB7_9HYME
MCIHIGGGRTDIAIISNNSILFSYTTRCAGDYLTRSVQEYIAKEHALKLECFLLPRLNSQPEQQAMSISETIEITLQEIRENVVQFQLKENVIPAIHRVLRTAGNKAAETISDLKKKVKTEKSTRAMRQKYEGDPFEIRTAQNPLDNALDACVKYRDTIYKQLIIEQYPSREVLIKNEDLG